MKKKLILVLLLFLSGGLFAQRLTDNNKLASLCKVWGFLKYYHPAVGKGKLDWDKALVEHMQPVLAANNSSELSNIYVNWINSLGTIKKLKHSHIPMPDNITHNLDLKWIDDNSLFTDSASAMLHFIAENKKSLRNYYVQKKMLVGNPSFTNENEYTDSLYPSVGLRFVTLCRYWNIVQYYFPYKYLMDEDWNISLEELIPSFIQAKDTGSYCYAMMAMLAKTSDSHAGLGCPPWARTSYISKILPMQYTVIDDKAVVTGFYNDSLAKIDDIRYGDAIESINGLSVKEIIAKCAKYISASNQQVMLYRFSTSGALNVGKGDSASVTLDRDGTTLTKTVHKYSFSQFQYSYSVEKEPMPARILNNNIGYLDLDVLKRKQVSAAMKFLKNTDAIIIDVRNYPHLTGWDICSKISGVRNSFAKFTKPVYDYPGTFKYNATAKCGRKRRHTYKGKVIVLCNEHTQSHAEFTCMMFQTLPKVTVIGSQTAGADGDVSRINLPGGYYTLMTGLGVYYPDGSQTQRIGIVPNIRIVPTIEGLRQHKDEVLDRAINYATTGK